MNWCPLGAWYEYGYLLLAFKRNGNMGPEGRSSAFDAMFMRCHHIGCFSTRGAPQRSLLSSQHDSRSDLEDWVCIIKRPPHDLPSIYAVSCPGLKWHRFIGCPYGRTSLGLPMLKLGLTSKSSDTQIQCHRAYCPDDQKLVKEGIERYMQNPYPSLICRFFYVKKGKKDPLFDIFNECIWLMKMIKQSAVTLRWFWYEIQILIYRSQLDANAWEEMVKVSVWSDRSQFGFWVQLSGFNKCKPEATMTLYTSAYCSVRHLQWDYEFTCQSQSQCITQDKFNNALEKPLGHIQMPWDHGLWSPKMFSFIITMTFVKE